MRLSAIPATPETAVQAKYRLSAYPNPSGANFRLEIESTQPATVRLGIHDLLGREVASRTLDLVPGLHTIGAAQLPTLVPGQYIVTLYTLTGVETLRLVKW